MLVRPRLQAVLLAGVWAQPNSAGVLPLLCGRRLCPGPAVTDGWLPAAAEGRTGPRLRSMSAGSGPADNHGPVNGACALRSESSFGIGFTLSSISILRCIIYCLILSTGSEEKVQQQKACSVPYPFLKRYCTARESSIVVSESYFLSSVRRDKVQTACGADIFCRPFTAAIKSYQTESLFFPGLFTACIDGRYGAAKGRSWPKALLRPVPVTAALLRAARLGPNPLRRGIRVAHAASSYSFAANQIIVFYSFLPPNFCIVLGTVSGGAIPTTQ